MATRKTFTEDDDSIANAIPHNPVRRYACTATQCPMPGVNSGEGGRDLCAYHYGAFTGDWPRITQALLDWALVTEEINHCRRALNNPAFFRDPELLDGEFKAAVARVLQGAGPWIEDLKPGLTRGGRPDTYSTWSYRLECFIGQRVVECLSKRIGRKAA